MTSTISPDIAVNISDTEDDVTDLECIHCNLKFEDIQVYSLHLQSVAHTNKVLECQSMADDVKPFVGRTLCDICSFAFSGEKSYKLHLKDEIHLRRLQMIKEDYIKKEMLEERSRRDKEACQKKIVNQMKAKLPEENFDDFNPDSNELHCKICDVSCYGMIPFKMHLDGAKHKKKLERRGVDGSVLIDDMDKSLEELIEECREPLIGLEYVIEYDDDSIQNCGYLCELCDTKLITSQMIHHLTGLSHRHKYYKIHDPRIYECLWNLVPRSLKSSRAREYAKRTEGQIGRKSIRYWGEPPVYEAEFRDKNFCSSEKVVSRLHHFPSGSSHKSSSGNHGESRKRSPDLRLIEKAIAKCDFDVEKDIEAAIHVTNILVEAMLKYKLKELDKAGKTNDELEKKLRESRKDRSLLDPSSISDAQLSQAIDETEKLAKEIIQGDKALHEMASTFLYSLDKKLIHYMEKGSNHPEGHEPIRFVISHPLKRFKFGL